MNFLIRLCVPLLCSLIPPVAGHAQESGQTVVQRGTVERDFYAAGRSVDVYADVQGDVVVAGGRVSVGERVAGDVTAAGGSVVIRARVDDDLRIAGGELLVTDTVGDDLIAAGGSLTVTANARVGGRAWVAGGTLNLNGDFDQELRAAGDKVMIAGRIGGDADVYADTLEVLPGASIVGTLTYYGNKEPVIAEDANIGALKLEAPPEGMEPPSITDTVGVAIAALLSVPVTGVVLVLLFPGVARGAAAAFQEAPWKSLGVGLAVAVVTPLLIMLAMAMLVGLWLALLLMALWFMVMLSGFFAGAVSLGRLALPAWRRGNTPGRAKLAAVMVVALLVVLLVAFVPLLGGVAVLALLLMGTGALATELMRRYRGTRSDPVQTGA